MRRSAPKTEHRPVGVEAGRDLYRPHLPDRHEGRRRKGQDDRERGAREDRDERCRSPAATLDAAGVAPMARSTSRSSRSERS